MPERHPKNTKKNRPRVRHVERREQGDNKVFRAYIYAALVCEYLLVSNIIYTQEEA